MISDLLNTYYEGIARKRGWEVPLSEAIRFVSRAASTEGKVAFVEGNNRFLRAVKSAKRTETVLDGDTACVVVAYDLISPKGSETTQDVFEIWTAKDGLLDSCTIYFDTAAFKTFMAN